MPRSSHYLLALILLLALVLRLHELARYSFWLDEILTVQLSVGRGYAHLDFPQNELITAPIDLIALDDAPPFWRIWTSLDRDVHPPMFYLLLRGWREVIGDGDCRIRLLSVVLSLSALVMLYLAVEPLSGRATALWGALLMALAGPQIEYAQEMRSYMLLLTALLGAAAALVRVEKFGPTPLRCIALASAALVAALTHLAALPALVCLIAYSLIRLRGRALKWTILMFFASATVFTITWMPFWLEQMRGFGERIDFTTTGDTSPLHTLAAAAELPLRFFTESAIRPRWVGVFAALLYLLPSALIFRHPRRWDLLLWWVWLVGYVSFITLSDLARQGHALEWIRYTLPASPAAYVLASGMLAHLRGWRRHIVPVALSLACAAALPAAYVRWKADWRDLAAPLSASATPNDVIVVHSLDEDDWRARTTYLCLRYYAPAPAMDTAFVSAPTANLLERIAGRDVWLVAGGPELHAERLLPAWEGVEMHYSPNAGSLARLRPGRAPAEDWTDHMRGQ